MKFYLLWTLGKTKIRDYHWSPGLVSNKILFGERRMTIIFILDPLTSTEGEKLGPYRQSPRTLVSPYSFGFSFSLTKSPDSTRKRRGYWLCMF